MTTETEFAGKPSRRRVLRDLRNLEFELKTSIKFEVINKFLSHMDMLIEPSHSVIVAETFTKMGYVMEEATRLDDKKSGFVRYEITGYDPRELDIPAIEKNITEMMAKADPTLAAELVNILWLAKNKKADFIEGYPQLTAFKK